MLTISLDPQKKRLLENFIALSILQGANYILPLITLPYLVRVLGPEKIGLIAFAQAFIQYFCIITDYGFNLAATREVSINRDNKKELSKIFSSVMIIKFGLLILSFIIMTIIVFSFEKFKKDWIIYYLTFGVVIGQVLFPIWFFQGMEKMKYISFLNIIAKLIFTISIFIFVHKVSDYIYVPLLNSLGFIISGVLAIVIILKNFNVKFIFPKGYILLHHLKEGGHIFLSRISISFYTISNTFFLGLLTNNTIVGYYSIAERLINVLKSFYSIILQVMYPFISKLIISNRKKALNYIGKELRIFLLIGILLNLLIIIFAKDIIIFLFGNKFIRSVSIFQILSVTPIIIFTSAVIGQQVLLNFNLRKIFTLSIIFPSLFHIPLLFTFIKFFGVIGAAISVVITETLILLIRIFFLWKRRKNLLLSIFYMR